MLATACLGADHYGQDNFPFALFPHSFAEPVPPFTQMPIFHERAVSPFPPENFFPLSRTQILFLLVVAAALSIPDFGPLSFLGGLLQFSLASLPL